MKRRQAPAAVIPLLPHTISRGRLHYAPGVRAGRWVFATGLKAATDDGARLSPAVTANGSPQRDSPPLRREAEHIFSQLRAVLAAGGSDLRHVVRVDQSYTGAHAVEPYHDARRDALRDHVPPSTSTLTTRLLLAGQNIEVQAIGVVPDPSCTPQHIRPPQQSEVHPSSGYSLALVAGDFVFIAGRYADAPTFGDGLAAEARMPEGHLWKGMAIRLETEYVIARKLVPALVAAGSSLDRVVKCQVYLRDPHDFAPFVEVWRKHFPRRMPATTLIPTATPGFNLRDARIEINTIALRGAGSTVAEAIDAQVMPAFGGGTQAMRAGDLLFISGLLAIDRDGLIAAAKPDPAQPFFGSSVEAQMACMLRNAERLCRAAGTSLGNVVRIQQFHTDLREFHAAAQAWQRHLPAQPLPLSAIEVPFLPVPGCTVMLELWVYAP